MKRLFLFLVFLGMGGSAFAQSCTIDELLDQPCVCEFAMDNLTMEAAAGVQYHSTDSFKRSGSYLVNVNFQCPDSPTIQRVQIYFAGGPAKTCQVSFGSSDNNLCVSLPNHSSYQDYKGKKLKKAKQALQDFLEAAGY